MQSPLNGERGTEYIATTNQKKELRNKARDWIGQSYTGRRLRLFSAWVGSFLVKKIALSLLLRGWGGGGALDGYLVLGETTLQYGASFQTLMKKISSN